MEYILKNMCDISPFYKFDKARVEPSNPSQFNPQRAGIGRNIPVLTEERVPTGVKNIKKRDLKYRKKYSSSSSSLEFIDGDSSSDYFGDKGSVRTPAPQKITKNHPSKERMKFLKEVLIAGEKRSKMRKTNKTEANCIELSKGNIVIGGNHIETAVP